jgi:hypothetical protein
MLRYYSLILCKSEYLFAAGGDRTITISRILPLQDASGGTHTRTATHRQCSGASVTRAV